MDANQESVVSRETVQRFMKLLPHSFGMLAPPPEGFGIAKAQPPPEIDSFNFRESS